MQEGQEPLENPYKEEIEYFDSKISQNDLNDRESVISPDNNGV